MAVVILEPYSNFTLTLPQAELVQYFPQSLLTSALEYPGPILLTNPVITPELLQEIQKILTTQRIVYHPLAQTNLTTAADYLQMPTLLLLNEPLLSLFQTLFPQYHLLELETWSKAALDILGFAAANNACQMLNGLLQLTPRGEEMGSAFLGVCQWGYVECVRLFLRRFDPSQVTIIYEMEQFMNGPLHTAIKAGQLETIRVLLEDPRTTFKFTDTFPSVRIIDLIPVGRYDIYALIISDPRLSAETIVQDLSSYFDRPPLIRLLLTRPDLDLNNPNLYQSIMEFLIPNFQFTHGQRVETLYSDTQLDSIRLIFSDPRFDLNRFLKDIFEFPQLIYNPILLELLINPRVDLNTLPLGLYITLIYSASSKVLRAILHRSGPIYHGRLFLNSIKSPSVHRIRT